MDKRRVGEFEVSAIGLGCMSLSHAYGAPPPREQQEAVLKGALDAGYTFFDTAAVYGLGRNETLVGEVLGKRRSEYRLASKCGLTNGGKREQNGHPDVLRSVCEDSLRNLNTDVIDLYYLHRMDKNVPIEESIGALSDLKAEGKIRAIGVSEISAASLRRAHATHPITALQSEYSPWSRNAELGALAACRELGIAYVAFSPVGRGLLAGRMTADTAFEEGDLRIAMPRFMGDNFLANLKLYEAFAAIARDAGCTPAQLCLAWLLAKDPIIVPIPGTTSPDHMRENAAAASVRLSPEIIARVDSTVNGDAVHGSRYGAAAQAGVDTERMPCEV